MWGTRVAQLVRSLDLTTHKSLSPRRRGFSPGFVNYEKDALDLPVYQLIVHGQWFSSGTPACSTTKTRRHDIAEILLKVALCTKNQIKYILYVDITVHSLNSWFWISLFFFYFNASAGGLLIPGVSFVSSQCFVWIDTSADRLLVPEGTIRPVVNVSVPTCVIRYNHIDYWNLQSLNNIIIIETKVLSPQT